MGDSAAPVYDFIVIGGGTAGLVVASRLSEDPNNTVCVLEAGEDRTDEQDVRVPGFGFKTLARPDMLWPFHSVPQSFANNRAISQPRGKALGGCSTINMMTAVRGNAEEYNAYETLGNDGWNWQNILPYFRKSETHTVTPEDTAKFGVQLNTTYHGTEGPIHRTFPQWTSSGLSHYFEVMKTLGFEYKEDPTNGDNSGVWPVQFTIDPTDAVRSAAASGYPKPVANRNNLHVLTGAYVTKVLIGPEKRTGGLVLAEGVEFIQDEKRFTARAKKEVILCAGAFKSPQILQLSGIGDPKVLNDHGLKCHVSLPSVGRNYRFTPICSILSIYMTLPHCQDHFWCSFTAETTSGIETNELLADPARMAQELELYEKSKTGMFSTFPGGSGLAMLPTSSFIDVDDFQKLVADAHKLHSAEYDKVANVRKKWLADGKLPFLELAFMAGFLPAGNYQPEPGKQYVSCFIAIQHPFSRGTVQIASVDPFTDPAIDPCVLDNIVDIKILVEAVKFVRRIFASGNFQGTTKEVIPGVSSDAEIEQYIREAVQTVYHPIGTASMLPREEGGVVDTGLKVYGTTNLRVVDASIMPIQISGHPMLTVYAIAEKAADMIKLSYA